MQKPLVYWYFNVGNSSWITTFPDTKNICILLSNQKNKTKDIFGA